MGRYRQLRTMSQHDRLRQAEHLVERPEELATEFAASIAHFAQYKNVGEHFCPPRLDRTFATGVKRTNDLVLRLQVQPTVVSVGSATRRREHGWSGRDAVAAPRLACDYVDRELLVQRTTRPGEWEGGTRNRGSLRLDVLLADATDRTPIVGELKLPRDMDSFFSSPAAPISLGRLLGRVRRLLPLAARALRFRGELQAAFAVEVRG